MEHRSGEFNPTDNSYHRDRSSRLKGSKTSAYGGLQERTNEPLSQLLRKRRTSPPLISTLIRKRNNEYSRSITTQLNKPLKHYSNPSGKAEHQPVDEGTGPSRQSPRGQKPLRSSYNNGPRRGYNRSVSSLQLSSYQKPPSGPSNGPNSVPKGPSHRRRFS